MSRYFFDVRDSDGFHRDQTGDEFADVEEAREQCQALLPDIAREELPDGESHIITCDVRDEAGRVAEGDGFRADLLSFLDGDGRPLWDGRGAFSPSVRDAISDEDAAFQRSFADAVAAGDADLDDPADWLVFLVDVREAEGGEP